MRKLLPFVRAVVLLLAMATPVTLRAAEYTDSAALDELFAQLHSAQSEGEASELTQQIWAYWLSPDDAVLAKRMQDATVASNSGDLRGAIALLDGVVKDYPDYPEGWNQRATLHYMTGDLDASLADIAKVLALEPRHFGALSGRVLIYLKQGKRSEALKDMLAALNIDAYLGERALFPELAQNVTHV